MRREPERTLEWAEQASAISSEYGFPFWLGLGKVLRGWALAVLGRAEGIDEYRQGVSLFVETGCQVAAAWGMFFVGSWSGFS